MPYTVIQGGTSLQMLDSAGTIATLTLPSGITISASKTPRFAIFGRYVVVVNSPNRPVTVDDHGIVRVLTPLPPASILAGSGTGSGGLTGTYQAKQTFRILDVNGNLISESDFGPAMAAVSITSNFLKVTNMDLSADLAANLGPYDTVQAMMYRTTTSGTTYFPWVSVDGNVQTQVQDDLADLALSSVAAPVLGSAPDLTLIAEFRNRLWGVDRVNIDDLRYTETGSMWQWAGDNSIPIPKVGVDSRGITGLIGRRESLGIGRRNQLRQITGTGNTDFRVVNLTENVGIESQETVAVYNDTAWWLWKDGVYQWDSNGIKCVSDGVGGKGAVRSWFATNNYFNRGQFSIAFAHIIPERHVYRLFLCSAGSSTIDRFVDFDFAEGVWWGPHKVDAFTPSCTVLVSDANDTPVAMVGSTSDYLWKEQATRTDGAATAIDLSIDTKHHDCGTPMIDKFFGQMDVVMVPQSGGFMNVTPSAGELDAVAATQTLQADLRDAAQCLGRVGHGKMVTLNFRQNTVGQDVEILGYELPFSEFGHRI